MYVCYDSYVHFLLTLAILSRHIYYFLHYYTVHLKSCAQ